MFCRDCGKQIVDEAVICVGCGRQIKSSPGSNDEKWTNGTMSALVIGSILIPLFGLIYGAINVNTPSSEKKKQAQILLIVACSSFIVSSIFLTGVMILAASS